MNCSLYLNLIVLFNKECHPKTTETTTTHTTAHPDAGGHSTTTTTTTHSTTEHESTSTPTTHHTTEKPCKLTTRHLLKMFILYFNISKNYLLT